MKIFDKNNILLALFIKENSNVEKDFKTDNEEEFQVASFNLKKNTKIERHYHPENERIIKSTSEALIMVNGQVLVTIYDDEKIKIHESVIGAGEVVVFFKGGHELDVQKDSYFFEIKQGPYDEQTDKIRF